MFKSTILILLLISSTLNAKPLPIPDQFNLNEEELCLVQAIYFEARGESFIGQLAVGSVILQRLESKSFPNTICGVVQSGKYWKGNPVKNKCAFSYWCDGKTEKMYNYNSYDEAVNAANLVLSGASISLLNKATHYHAFYVKPNWSTKMKKVIRIGKHLFYREY
tara:strand:+ start:258 stop:749 length:492 start_codon:yes stop_codon:yes gene_type:complete